MFLTYYKFLVSPEKKKIAIIFQHKVKKKKKKYVVKVTEVVIISFYYFFLPNPHVIFIRHMLNMLVKKKTHVGLDMSNIRQGKDLKYIW